MIKKFIQNERFVEKKMLARARETFGKKQAKNKIRF
jgi:hypothetical protein